MSIWVNNLSFDKVDIPTETDRIYANTVIINYLYIKSGKEGVILQAF